MTRKILALAIIAVLRRSAREVWLFALALPLAGCLYSGPDRHPLPADQQGLARVRGYGLIRFWGDLYTPEFDTWIKEKYRENAAAIADGSTPRAATEADFLSISGGGDKGAFAAGLLKGWTDSKTRPQFEAVAGVSAGALGAPFAFLGPDYDDQLHDIFVEADAAKLYKSRGILGYFSDALNDTAPLEKMIRAHATDAFLDRIAAEHRKGRRLIVLTTNLDAQRPVIWDLSGIAASGNPNRRELFTKVLLASAALPGIFPPVLIQVVGVDGKMYDEMHVDGGVSAELVFVPPESRLIEVQEKFLKHARQRKLYAIENGEIVPQFAASKLEIIALSQRAVATMVKFQVVANLRELERVAKSSQTEFYFNAIPTAFTAISPGFFDTIYAHKLYDAGYHVGLNGKWSTDPAQSPELFLLKEEGKPPMPPMMQ